MHNMRKVISIIFIFIISISTFSPLKHTEEEAEPVERANIEAINLIDYWEEHPEESPKEEILNAHFMANVAEAVCPIGASEDCLVSVMACVWNRANAVGFPNTIEEVAKQPYQWQGLTANSSPSKETKALARKMIKEWQDNGELPISSSCVYIVLDTDGIWFRSNWDGNGEFFVPYY